MTNCSYDILSTLLCFSCHLTFRVLVLYHIYLFLSNVSFLFSCHFFCFNLALQSFNILVLPFLVCLFCFGVFFLSCWGHFSHQCQSIVLCCVLLGQIKSSILLMSSVLQTGDVHSLLSSHTTRQPPLHFSIPRQIRLKWKVAMIEDS